MIMMVVKGRGSGDPRNRNTGLDQAREPEEFGLNSCGMRDGMAMAWRFE